MKGMKKILMVLMVLSMVVVFAAPASAVSLDCTVTMAGYNADTGLVEVRLFPVTKTSDKKFTVTDPADQNLMLSVALSAMATGQQVRAEIDWQAGGEVGKMVLLPQAAP